jgi:copper chaperone CopZ
VVADPARHAYIWAMTTFSVSGMTCNNCRSKVETVLRGLAPDAVVTLDPPELKTGSALGADAFNAALAVVGKYRVAASDVFTAEAKPSWIVTYYPLLLVIGLIAVAALSSGSAMGWMRNFMAGFFIVFGAFKMLDVPAFANSYARYDVVAKRFKPWGYAYPFVEVALGLGFLFSLNMVGLSWITLVLSLVGAIGVIQANLSKQVIQCACLGTVFKLPMSVVTIIENLGMAAMAAWMIAVL